MPVPIAVLDAPHLDEGAELFALVKKRGGEGDHRQLQIGDARVERELHRGRIDVVRRLAEIEMIVRVHELVLTALLAEDLQRAVSPSPRWHSCSTKYRLRPESCRRGKTRDAVLP